MKVLSGREASIFSCLTDTLVTPEPALPPVRETTAVAFFDGWLERSPRLNRVGLRILLHAAELAPLATGSGARLRRLDAAARGTAVIRLEAARNPAVRQLVKLWAGICFLSYYGDDEVMRQLGYDPDLNLERARALRVAEARP